MGENPVPGEAGRSVPRRIRNVGRKVKKRGKNVGFIWGNSGEAPRCSGFLCPAVCPRPAGPGAALCGGGMAGRKELWPKRGLVRSLRNETVA